MRIGFYSAALRVAGGGEKYLLTIVEEAAKLSPHDVVLLSPTRPRPEEWERLGVSLTRDSFTWRPTRDRLSLSGTRDLDLFVSMRSMPPVTHAARSVAIVQFPHRMPWDRAQPPRSPRELGRLVKAALERRVVSAYDLVVCYSDFVRRYAVASLGRPDTVVIYPPVDRAAAKAAERPLILSVGRFFEAKRQDALIDAFGKLRVELGDDSPWELHLAGGLGRDAASAAYLAELRERAIGMPVVFHPNASLPLLQRLYAQASVFWHAMGLGSENQPARQEHFGIATVEAMNYGCVPIVIGLGGQPEIVTDGADGLLWRSVDELVARTHEVIACPERRMLLSRAAVATGERFGTERFRREVREMILSPVDLRGRERGGCDSVRGHVR